MDTHTHIHVPKHSREIRKVSGLAGGGCRRGPGPLLLLPILRIQRDFLLHGLFHQRGIVPSRRLHPKQAERSVLEDAHTLLHQVRNVLCEGHTLLGIAHALLGGKVSLKRTHTLLGDAHTLHRDPDMLPDDADILGGIARTLLGIARTYLGVQQGCAQCLVLCIGQAVSTRPYS